MRKVLGIALMFVLSVAVGLLLMAAALVLAGCSERRTRNYYITGPAGEPDTVYIPAPGEHCQCRHRRCKHKRYN